MIETYMMQVATVFMGLFAIMNPVANTPIFLGLTSGDDPATKRKIALRALILTFVIVGLFCAAGRLIFEMFGITLPAFRTTGGLLVFLIGFHMLQGEPSSVHNPSDEDKDKSREAELDVAISPLTMPILAGPGTIATAMNFTAAGDAFHFATTMSAFFLLCLVTYLFFVFGGRLVQFVGQSAINAVTRLMGLILAVMGTQMVIDGVSGVMTSLNS